MRRRQAGDASALAGVLEAASPGCAPSVLQDLQAAAARGTLPPLLLVAGELDAKFSAANRKLSGAILGARPVGNGAGAASVEAAVVPGSGHAVHVERPVELVSVLHQFLAQQ